MLFQITDEDRVALPDAVAANLSRARFCEVTSEDGRIVLTPLGLADGGAWERMPEIIAAAQGWLAKSEREFAAERRLAGSQCIWEAARAAFAAVGMRRGLAWETEQDMFRLAVRLDEESGGGYTHLGRLGVAQSFRDNALGILQWEDWEFEMGRPAVERLVAGFTEMAEAGEVGKGSDGNRWADQAAAGDLGNG